MKRTQVLRAWNPTLQRSFGLTELCLQTTVACGLCSSAVPSRRSFQPSRRKLAVEGGQTPCLGYEDQGAAVAKEYARMSHHDYARAPARLAGASSAYLFKEPKSPPQEFASSIHTGSWLVPCLMTSVQFSFLV